MGMVNEIKAQLNASFDTCRAMGAHAILITDFKEFLQRARKTATELGYQYWEGSVNYYDIYPIEAWGWTKESVQPVFHKPRRYEFQREYRIVLNTKTYTKGPITLDIGNIRDICFYVKTENLLISE